MMTMHRVVGYSLSVLWLPVVLIGLWWYFSASSTSVFFPPLSRILTATVETWVFDSFVNDLLPSLSNLAVGFFIAGFLGVALGALLWKVRPLALAGSPLIFFFYVLPAPAILPVAIGLFGIETPMKIFVIVFTCIWPVLLNTVDGMRATDSEKLEVARVFRMNWYQVLWHVVLPAASPQIFAGLRTALAFGIVLMVVSEMVAATEGIGYFILYAQQTFAIVEMWTGILVLAVTGSLLNLAFILLERRILRWEQA